MTLSVLSIKAAKPKQAAYKLSDSDGLYVFVGTNGTKSWRMNYRYLGRQKTLSFGVWPEVGLADARAKRDEARRQLAADMDPSEQQKLRQLAKSLAAENTFKSIAEEWLTKLAREQRAEITLDKLKWLLGLAYPSIGNRPVSEIKATELLLVLRKVENRGHLESARRMRSMFSRIFRYAIATARAERDVAADLRGALISPTVTHRAAITSPLEVGALLRAIDGYTGQVITHVALRMAPYIFLRPGELRKAEWTEIDTDSAVWTISAEKMKMRREFSIPLSRQVLALIAEIRPITGEDKYLFPSFQTRGRPMSENTINGALRRLGYAQDEMTGHGFRAMASTLLNEMGKWNPDAIERQLAHSDSNGVRRAYARGEYWQERVIMMQDWSDYLDSLRSGATILRPQFANG
jgi:integrase